MNKPLSTRRSSLFTASHVLAAAVTSLVFAFHPLPALGATITYVQGNYSTPQTPQTSVPVTFTSAQVAGDLNVVVVGWNDSTATVSTVTDKSGNTYTRAVGPTIQTGVASQSIYYAKNIVAAGAGVNIVTVTFSAAAVSPDIRILEYSGADPNNPVDVTAASSGSSLTSSSGAATTTNATDLIFGANLVQPGTTGPGSGFTSRMLTVPDGDIAEDEMVTAVGSYTATAPLSPSGQWIMQMVAFRTPNGPTVTSVSPSIGPLAGGTAVTITGLNFAAGATVTFGGVAATNVVVASSTSITATTPAGSGAVTVTVTVGAESGSLASGFTYLGAPAVTSVSPNAGSTLGGTAVTITGANFAAGAAVTFGGVAATNVVVASSTSITATTPAGSTGPVTVTVTVGTQSGSLPSGFTYALVPTVTSISPNTGLAAGGTSVTITGTNFASGATVTFGGVAATNVDVVSSTSITATTSAGTAGAVTVTVTVGAYSGSLTNGFTYIGVPTVTSVSPNSGSIGGGTAVTITGTNFAAGATVTFATAAATNVVVVSSTSITATTPAGTAGAVTVTVTNTGAQSGSLLSGFTYVAATTITYVQSNYSTPQASETSVPVTFTAAQVAGDLNVVVVGWNDSTATVSSVTDKSGNTYTLAVGPTTQSGVASQSIYYAKNIVAAAAGANIVTVTFSTAAAYPDIRILEYSGADPNNPVDVTAAASGNSASSSSGSATTTNATDLIFGANLVQTDTTGPGTGFTSRILTPQDGDIAEDEMVTATGSYSATAPLRSGQWIMQMVAFRTPSGGTTTPTVTSVSPNTGSTAGGAAVTITGTNFATGATVTFGTAAATNVSVVSSTSITATTPAGSAGAVSVTVTVNGHNGSLTSGFTYITPPTVTSVSPSFGSTGGGTVVTITGTSFASGATVMFGAAAATNVVVASATSITATTPAGTVGPVSVTVTVSGQSGSLTSGFTYAVIPSVTSVSPNVGATAGGTAVTITGTNFATGATVTFGTAAATNVVVVGATSITATTPSGTIGAVAVTVTVGGYSGSLANGFTYIGVPTVTSVSPNSGSTAGGTAVTITGTNFVTGATVTFGTAAATSVAVVSSTSITATTPAGNGGPVTVTVTNPASQTGSLANGFTYSAPTNITYVQGNYATPQTPQTSVPVTFTSAQGSGDLNVVVVGWNDSTATVSSVTDKSGNTYALAVGPTIQTGVATESIYYAKKIVAAAAGANIVTVTFSKAAVSPDIRILEYAGADTANPVDVTAAATGSGGTASSGTVITTNATDLIFGADLTQSGTVGPGTGFTSRLLTSPDGDIAEDEMVTSIGSYAATADISPPGQWIMQMVAFRTPSVVTPTVTSITPNTGSTAGGTAVTITGTNFATPATVTFGGTAASNVAVVNSTTITAMTPAGIAGLVTVTVSVAGQSGSLSSGFVYIGTPTVTSVSPNTGSTAGGTVVTITGTNFASGATVAFGTSAATNVQVVSSTSITATSPAGSGSVTVTVTNPGPQSGSLTSAFTYAAIPAVTTVSPNYGPTTGGTPVTITGSNFGSGATVTFGTTAATNVIVSNSTTITATTPAGTLGPVNVVVTVSAQSGTLPNGFSYTGLPTVTSVSPNSGTTVGGKAVTITGTNFASGATVAFGANAATNVVVVNTTTITATTPPGTLGAVTVTVTNVGAESGSLNSGFTYANATTITYVQSNYATPQTPQTSVPVTFTSAQAAGDLNVIVVGWNDSTATVSKVADSSGNTYTLAVGPTIQTGAATQSIYYAKNILSATAGSNVVTVTFATAATAPDIRILEYSGADPNAPVDVTAAASGSSATSSSGSATTTNATDLIFGANLVQTDTTGPGTGFTSRILTPQDGDIAEDEMVTTAGSYSATAPLRSGQWIMQMVAFRTIDTTAPTAPASLSASAISDSQINLSWTASTDVIGVSGYRVERCQGVSCANFAQIGTSTTASYIDANLTPNTSYSYRVRATDADGNLSTYSNTATTSTLVALPSAPTLSVTGGGAAPVVIDQGEYYNDTSLTTHTLSGIPLMGDAIILAASSHQGVIFTPSDTFGNTFIPIAGPTSTTIGADVRTEIWYVRNPITGPYNDNIVMNLSESLPLVMSVVMVQNSDISSPIDAVSFIGTDNGTESLPITSPSLTTSGSNELLLGFSKSSMGEVYSAGTGFTLLQVASSNDLEAESEVVATPGVYNATVDVSVPENWEAAAVALGNNPNQTTLSWTASTELDGTIASYQINRCQGAGCTSFTQIGTTTAPTTTYNDTALAPATSYSYQILAVDTSNNVGPASATVTFVTPAALPSLPGNLTATQDSVNHAQIDLAWTASQETGGTIASYTVQRCAGAGCTTGFATIGTTSTTTFNDSAPGDGSFTYRVQAVDTASHVSPYSNPAIGTTPPTQPGTLTAMPSTTMSQITLNWTASTDSNTVTYVIERCQGAAPCSPFAQIGTATGTTYTDTLLPIDTTFTYEVEASDAYGNLSPFSNTATATTPNLPVPTAPGLSVADGGAAPIVVDEAEYYNQNSQTVHTLSGIPVEGDAFVLAAASDGQTVTLTPSDSFGNTWIPIAGPTNNASGAQLRTQLWYVRNPITGPNNDTITMNLSESLPLVMSLVMVQGSDISSPIDAMSLIGSDNGTQSTNVLSPTLQTSGTNELLLGFAKFSAAATYTASSGFTLLQYASSNDLEAESGSAPTPGSYQAMFNVTVPQTWEAVAVALGNNPNQTTLSWTASTEIGGGSIASYLVERCQGGGCSNFAQIGTTTAPTATYNDTGLTAGASYTYRVRAEDAVGTLGPYSATSTIVIPSPLPSLPGNLTATPASSTQITLTWLAAQETGGTINNYVIQRCLADAGTNSTGYPCSSGFQTLTTVSGTTTTYTDSSLNGGGVFNYRVQAIDANNVASPFSNTATASVPDTQAPSTPTNLQAQASVTASEISLSWTASTDNVGVSGYLVERCAGSNCVNFVQVGTSTTTSYTDMGLAPNTTYSYCVSATDAAGNVSPCSTPPATGMTPDFSGPGAPGSATAMIGSTTGPTVLAAQNLEDGVSTQIHTTGAFNSTGGNLILLYAYTYPGVTFTPTDTYNNTWIPIAGPTSGGNILTELWYAWDPIVGPGHTITVTLSANNPLIMSAIVLQNADLSSPIDAVSLIGSASGSTTVTSPSITTSANNDLLLGFAATSVGVTFTAQGGYILLPAASDNVLATETAPAASPSSYAANFMLSPSADWESAVVAALDNPNQATVSWSPASAGNSPILNYLIWRCATPSCSIFAQVGTVPSTSTTFTDTGLMASTSYTYEIQAEDATYTVGPFSNTTTIMTPAPTPSLPGNLTVTTSGTQNNLSWTASEEVGGTVSDYVVQRCAGAGCTNFATITTPTVAGTTYVDLNVSANTSYTYRVQGIDGNNSGSPFSNLATIVTTAP